MNNTEIIGRVKEFLKKNDFIIETKEDGTVIIRDKESPIIVSLEKSARHTLYVLLDCNIAEFIPTRHKSASVIITKIICIYRDNKLNLNSLKFKEVDHDT